VHTIYGIPNCDTCKKARRWLDAQRTEYRFHDVRADGIDRATLENWLTQVDLKTLLNTRSTTWRNLSGEQKANVDIDSALSLMLEHPTLIKRPVLVHEGGIEVGFKDERYRLLFD
jgi:Spx/MgsR family transcriptional regulator